jgi:hypothetical protein
VASLHIDCWSISLPSAAPSLGELRQALTIIAGVLNSGHFEISGVV